MDLKKGLRHEEEEAEEEELSISCDCDQMGRPVIFPDAVRAAEGIGALLCRGVALLRVLTLLQTERQRARSLEAWEPPSAAASQTLQVSEHINTPASMGDTGS